MGYAYAKEFKELSSEGLYYSATGQLTDINAIFFASSDVQQGMFSTNEWEPVPLPEFAMCGN